MTTLQYWGGWALALTVYIVVNYWSMRLAQRHERRREESEFTDVTRRSD